jgi:hypothetical protein
VQVVAAAAAVVAQGVAAQAVVEGLPLSAARW